MSEAIETKAPGGNVLLGNRVELGGREMSEHLALEEISILKEFFKNNEGPRAYIFKAAWLQAQLINNDRCMWQAVLFNTDELTAYLLTWNGWTSLWETGGMHRFKGLDLSHGGVVCGEDARAMAVAMVAVERKDRPHYFDDLLDFVMQGGFGFDIKHGVAPGPNYKALKGEGLGEIAAFEARKKRGVK